MSLFNNTLRKLKRGYLVVISSPEEFILCMSSAVINWSLLLNGNMSGFRLFMLTVYCKLIFCPKPSRLLEEMLLMPLFCWEKIKLSLLRSTNTFFEVYYGLQKLLKKASLQPYSTGYINNTKQVCLDVQEICYYSVNNLLFVLRHPIMTFVDDNYTMELIGNKILYYFEFGLLETTEILDLFLEIETKLDSNQFERLLYGCVINTVRNIQDTPHSELFYMLCSAFIRKYKIIHGELGNLVFEAIRKKNYYEVLEFLLQNIEWSLLNNKFCLVQYSEDMYLYSCAVHYNEVKKRQMLFLYGATPQTQSKSTEVIPEINEDLLHGLLYCLHYKVYSRF